GKAILGSGGEPRMALQSRWLNPNEPAQPSTLEIRRISNRYITIIAVVPRVRKTPDCEMFASRRWRAECSAHQRIEVCRCRIQVCHDCSRHVLGTFFRHRVDHSRMKVECHGTSRQATQYWPVHHFR